MKAHSSSWRKSVLEFTGFTLALVGISVVSFKWTGWSASLFHLEIKGNVIFFLQLGAVLTVTGWLGSGLLAIVVGVAEWGRSYERAMEEAREQMAQRRYDPDDDPWSSFLQMQETMNEYWISFRRTENETDAKRKALTATLWHARHWLGIRGILAIHIASWGFSAYSLSIVHVTVPLEFWLSLVASSVLVLPVAAFVMPYTYAVVIQDPESRERGESAMDFLSRTLLEEEE
jgi:hypothetical protein